VISFIVPAHNEQACLGRTLQAIHDSATIVGQPYEIIVVDDASTDATAEIARHHNATVVAVNHRQIAATRNSGGRAARGDRIFFIDADTIINARAVAAALRAMDKGAVGGGAPAWFDKHEAVPLYGRLIGYLIILLPKLIAFSGGAFMFCTREAFHASGGFNERLYWGEEGSFALALKREGRFAGLWERVTTSGRRFRKLSGLELIAGGVRMVLSPSRIFTHRSLVEKVWYDSDRTEDDKVPNSLAARISNGIALVVLLVMLSGPLWNFVPRSLTPLASPVGKIRFVIGTFNCHVGLLFWPAAVVLLVNVLRQKRFAGSLQSLALIALCLWLAFTATTGVIRVWTLFGSWLAQG
jgi:glycosyltransferase involved in cell wall biosynthesis